MALIPVTPDAERRKLHHGETGNDVRAFGRMVARALKHAGLVPVNAQNGVYGHGLLLDTLRFQKLEGLAQDGVVGTATWHAIDPQMHTLERVLLKLAPKPKPIPNGVKVVHELRVMLALGLSHYTQGRPGALTLAIWKVRGGDCSGTRLLAQAIALGRLWDGYGYTGTMWVQGIAVTEADVELGDCIFYGTDGVTDHVATVSDALARLAIGFGAVPGRELGWFYRGDFMGFRRLV